MSTVRTILAATDLSGPARHAVERAAWLARERAGTKLTLCHVFSLPALERFRRILEPGAEKVEQSLLAGAEKELAELARELERRHGTAAATRLTVGRALDDIPAAARELDADLLVMGARGAHFVREFLLGSTTERVLRRTRCPLLAVKQRPHEPYRRVLVPVDFSAYSAPAIRLARALAPQAEVTVLHAFEVELESKMQFAGVAEETIRHYRARARQDAADAMQALLASVPEGPLAPMVVHGPAGTAILEAEQNVGADLIVLGKHGQSVMEELLLGSVTKHVLAHSACDVLVSGAEA
jgi:nucleotide-binding universal stress UspA family protein